MDQRPQFPPDAWKRGKTNGADLIAPPSAAPPSAEPTAPISVRPWLGFVYVQGSPIELVPIEAAYCRLGLGGFRHLDESKPLRSVAELISDHAC